MVFEAGWDSLSSKDGLFYFYLTAAAEYGFFFNIERMFVSIGNDRT